MITQDKLVEFLLETKAISYEVSDSRHILLNNCGNTITVYSDLDIRQPTVNFEFNFKRDVLDVIFRKYNTFSIGVNGNELIGIATTTLQCDDGVQRVVDSIKFNLRKYFDKFDSQFNVLFTVLKLANFTKWLDFTPGMFHVNANIKHDIKNSDELIRLMKTGASCGAKIVNVPRLKSIAVYANNEIISISSMKTSYLVDVELEIRDVINTVGVLFNATPLNNICILKECGVIRVFEFVGDYEEVKYLDISTLDVTCISTLSVLVDIFGSIIFNRHSIGFLKTEVQMYIDSLDPEKINAEMLNAIRERASAQEIVNKYTAIFEYWERVNNIRNGCKSKSTVLGNMREFIDAVDALPSDKCEDIE